MALPPVSVLFEPVTCIPAWMAKYAALPNTPVTSGYTVGSNGNVNGDPGVMAAAAGRKIGQPVSLEAYTLARYVTTEVGTKSVGERVAVLQDAINRVNYVEGSRSVLALLLYRQPAGHPNRGFYGPIHGRTSSGAVDVQTAPYKRWAATSKDPTYSNLMLVLAVLNGEIPADFNKGGDDQMGPEHLNDPVGSVRSHGLKRQYWVGPLPGVDPFRTITYRTMKDVDPKSILGQQLINRGVDAMQRPRPVWSGLPTCGGVDAVTSAMPAIPGGGTTALIVGSATLATAALVGAAVLRRRRR